MSRNMKKGKVDICFIIPNLGKGGMERFLSIISDELIVKEKQVVIITLLNNTVEYKFNESIRIIHINDIWNGNKINLFIKLYKTLKVIDPKKVIGFSEVFNPLSILASKLNGLDVYVSDRSNPLLRYKMRDKLTRFITYPISNGILAQTELAKSVFLKRNLNKNISVIPNPLMKFRKAKINSSKKVIITSGRLIPTKNHKELIDIFYEVVKDEWKLIIIGDGNERENLEKQVKELNITEKVFFAGQQDDMEFWLNKGSVFVYTSLSEGFPNALNEALGKPLATIAYNCPAGVSDLIDNNLNGFLIPLGNKSLFIEKLRMLINSEELRLRLMNEAVKSRKKYKSEVITNKLLDFINL